MGSWSMRLGITSKSDAYSWSSVRQQVTIPGSAASATLSFWYYPICQDSVEYDWQEVIIYDAKNDGVGNLNTAMYLDDVSVQVCY